MSQPISTRLIRRQSSGIKTNANRPTPAAKKSRQRTRAIRNGFDHLYWVICLVLAISNTQVATVTRPRVERRASPQISGTPVLRVQPLLLIGLRLLLGVGVHRSDATQEIETIFQLGVLILLLRHVG